MMRQFSVALVVTAALSTSAVQAEPSISMNGQYGAICAGPWATFGAKYGGAVNALTAVFRAPHAKLYTRTVTGTGNNAKCMFVPTRVTQHLAEVDGPVQGNDSVALANYLRNTKHPKNGNVNAWYKSNFGL